MDNSDYSDGKKPRHTLGGSENIYEILGSGTEAEMNPVGPPKPDPGMPSRFYTPFTLMLLFSIINVINYLDRGALAALLNVLREEFDLSHEAAGAVSSVFMVGYMTTSVVFAVLANVVKPNILVSTGLTTWCIAVLATAGALNYPMLLIARAFVGVGEASFITLAPVFIDDYAPLKVKNIYLAVFYIALPVGTAIGYLYGGVVGYLLDWRVAFLGEAFIMAPFVVCVIFIPPLKKHDSKAAAMFKSLRGILIMFYRLISNPLFDLMSFGYAMFTFSVGALLVWGVTYITTVLHLDLLIASAMFSILSLVSGIIGTALGGLVVDFAGRYFERFKNPMTIFVCVILVAAAIPFGFAAVWTDSAIFFFALITVFTTLLLATTAPVNAALLHAVTPELRPLAMAGSVLSIHLLGDVPSPILFGFIVDSTGNFKLAMYFLMAVLFLTVIAWGGACVVAEVKRRVQDQQYQEPQLVLFEMGEGAGDGEEEDDTDANANTNTNADINANAAVIADAGHPHEGRSSQTVHAVSVEQHQHQHHHLHELEHALDGFFSASFPETSPVILLAQTGEEGGGGGGDNRKIMISQATVPAHVQSSRAGGGGGDYVNPFEGHPSIRGGGPENQEASTHGMEAVAVEEEEEEEERKIGGI